MSVRVVVHTAHPVAVDGYQLDGYHRPLGGEAANLTVSVAPGVLFAGWLEAPPLGAACTVDYAGEMVLEGFLTGVTAQADVVQLRVEG
ncbi:MAG: hypothetical protein P9F75_07255 [Candidatus Contendobacter sp.]|nr:hypothetical protein [Candidatus Contendobacter sp.]